MKKLNITKEQFNRSRYFTDKYGELEYVSESGRLFKTNKGKVLMFNEESVDRSDRWTKILREKYNCHWYHTNDLNVDIKWLIDNEEIGIHSGDVVSLPIKWWAQPDKESPKWNNALIDTVVYRVKDEYGLKYSKYGKDFVIADKKKFWSDNTKWQREAGKELARQYKDLTDRENRLKYSGWGMVESTKKFGKKFNEGRGLKFMDDMVAARKAAGQDYETRMSRGRAAYDAKLDKDIPGDFDLKTKEEIKTLLPSMRRAGFTPEDIVDAYENGVRPNKCERKNGALYIGGTQDGYFVDVDEYISLLSGSKKTIPANALESTKKFGRKFNESADQTLEDIIDNIVTLSILSRDAESAEEMFQDLKQELVNMGLFGGQIHDDFDDFHDIAIDFAENHNFNKQFVEQAAVTLKSEIERGLSGNEFRESTRRARRSARRFR